MRIFVSIVNDDGENPNGAVLNVLASIEFEVPAVFYLDMRRDGRTLAADEAAFAGIIYDLDIVCNRGIIAVSFNSMHLAVVGEDDLTVVLDLGRSFVVARTPFVVALGECDLLLRDIHFDSAVDSGVDFLLGGGEDYIKFIHTSIADSLSCIVSRPCECALNSLVVIGCRAGRSERGEQIAVGGSKLVQFECRGIQARSPGDHDGLIIRGWEVVLLYDRRCHFFAAVDRISQSAFTEFVVFRCIQRDCKSVGHISLELTAIGGLIRDFRTFVAIDTIADQASCVFRLNLQIPVDIISLGKAGDRHLGVGDLLRDDGEGCFGGRCALCECAVGAIRGSYNGVCTDGCGPLSGNSQLVLLDAEAGALIILNRKGNKVGDILARSGFRTQGDHVAACISDLVLVDSDRSEGGNCALNRKVVFRL